MLSTERIPKTLTSGLEVALTLATEESKACHRKVGVRPFL
jgi:hypothetical protein